MRYGSIGGLEYEVPQSGLYCLCINVALCSTALQCICRVIRRSSMTMKAQTYYIVLNGSQDSQRNGVLSDTPVAMDASTVRASQSHTAGVTPKRCWLSLPLLWQLVYYFLLFADYILVLFYCYRGSCSVSFVFFGLLFGSSCFFF